MSNKNVVALDLPIPEISDMPEDTQKYFQICQEKLGMIPNVLTAYSQNLKQLEGFTRLYNELMLGEGELSKLEREMVAVVVSSENKCFYCLVAHGAAVRVLSGDPQLGDGFISIGLSVGDRADDLIRALAGVVEDGGAGTASRDLSEGVDDASSEHAQQVDGEQAGD